MESQAKDRIFFQEVGMRDGLQSANRFVETDKKIRLINCLSDLGLHKIEVTSFVSPKAVPLLADAEIVLGGIRRNPGVRYTALIPNRRGLDRALECNLDEVNVVMSASEAHNISNLRMTCASSLEAITGIVKECGSLSVNGTIATAFGCPFTGTVAPVDILRLATRFLEVGVDSLTVADTIGTATPSEIRHLCGLLKQEFPEVELTLHLHNTRGLAIANAFAGIEAGIRHFDSSFGGIGGCPYAPGATGNVCTEDLVHAFHFDGYRSGVDLDGLIQATNQLEKILGKELDGLVRKSGKKNVIHPMSVELQTLLAKARS